MVEGLYEIDRMNRICKIIMLISLVLFISCKKESVQEFPTSTKGEIQLSHVYYGNNSADWCSFYICDMGQLDIISDYILQINTAYAIGNYSGGQNLGDAMRQILRPLAGNYYIGGSNSYHGSLETGDYIVLAERWVEYYKNGERVINTMAWQYKVIKVYADTLNEYVFDFYDYNYYE